MKIIARLLIAATGLFNLTACYDAGIKQTIHDTGFIYCESGNVDFFNPQISDGNSILEAISAQIYDRLLIIDPVTQKPSANLATSWQVDDTGTVYTFDLKQNVQFHTTEWFTPTRALTANDVVFSFNRILDKNNAFHNVNSGDYPWFNSINFSQMLTSVEAITPHQVRFILSTPDNTFLSVLAASYAVIHSEEYAQQLAAIDEKALIDVEPIGTGPFKLVQFQKSELVRLKRHDGYWQGPANMSQVVFDISSRGTGSLAKLLRQECDVVANPISSQLPIIIDNDALTLYSQTAMNVAYIAINMQEPILQDQRVRKALSFAIDRSSLINSVYYNSGIEAKSILPPASWAYGNDNSHIRYDLNYAKGLLREAGVKDGLELTMWVPLDNNSYNPSPKKSAEIIQSDFAKLGIDLKLITSDILNPNELKEADIDLVLTGWNANSSDPDSLLRPLLSCDAKQAGFGVANWCNEEFDLLLDLAKETNQPRYRINIYRQIQNVLSEELPVIPLAHGVKYQANQSSLTGFTLSPFNTYSFHNVVRVKELN
ncbi:peptide ABC transporter substrate-binding protein SapA [Aliivibrio fischeri]|uniref:ABC transporter substrate-binding protein SapA n=1 Tax=Aliivibrio fischeri TaxID=668 RepID=UPI0012DA2A19|nr:ABC transporter substrate-binding protein SapA [Aliivibrio fischeri]MUJ27283.1 peptide ABC transporter substrate-binding protein SapA [Aliivibrio fischeri]